MMPEIAAVQAAHEEFFASTNKLIKLFKLLKSLV
jgi:hypothetical protein